MAAAAGLATLTVIRNEHLVERAATLGARALAMLGDLAERPEIREVRGRGLMLAVEFQGERASEHVEHLIRRGLERGLYLHPAGVRHEVIRLMPPLNVPEPALWDGIGILAEIIEEVARVRS